MPRALASPDIIGSPELTCQEGCIVNYRILYRLRSEHLPDNASADIFWSPIHQRNWDCGRIHGPRLSALIYRYGRMRCPATGTDVDRP